MRCELAFSDAIECLFQTGHRGCEPDLAPRAVSLARGTYRRSALASTPGLSVVLCGSGRAWQSQNGQSVRVPETSEFTTSDGVVIRFAYLGTGAPLYLCHGGPLGDRRGMAAQVAPLRDRFTLVSYDYRGSGASSTAPTSTYDFEHLADDLDELRVHLGHEHVDVLAHSMGVSVALHFALRHSHSARRIALAGVRRYRRAGCLGP
jgi:pimeloyl-ACP methyl ester carboxylesterase